MKIQKNARIAVWWTNDKMSWYRVAPHRRWEDIVRGFRRLPHFKYAVMHEYDKENGTIYKDRELGRFGKTYERSNLG